MSAKADFLYSRLPQVYRNADKDNGYILKSFLEVLCEYGIDLVQQDIDDLSNAYNIDKMDLDTLKHFARNYGYEYLINVSEDYQRRLIKHLPYLYSIRGTIPCLQYLANDLTGYDCEIEEFYQSNPNLVCVTLGGVEDKPLSTVDTKKTLGAFLPYYLDIILLIKYQFQYTIGINYSVSASTYRIYKFNGEVNFNGATTFGGSFTGTETI